MSYLPAAIAIAWGLLVGGCASIPGQGSQAGFGHRIGLPNSWQQLGQAAKQAALQPGVLWPLAGAATLGISGLDDDISEWASEERPVFGSNAARASDRLLDVSRAGLLVSGAFAPAQNHGDRLRGVGVEATTVLISGGLAEGLKSITRRRRPNGRNRNSLPSGHATQAAASNHLWRANLREYPIGTGAQRILGAATHTLTFATSWARIEANAHHPSDVLVGVAIGNFIADFLHISVLEAKSTKQESELAIEVVPRGAVLKFQRPLGARTQAKVWP